MADTSGWEGVILHNAFAPPGEAIQARINNQNALTSRYGDALQRQQQLDMREKELEQRKAEQYGLTNLANLNKNTDADKLMLGDKYANDVTAKQLQATYDDLIGKVGSTDPITFDYMLHNKTDEIGKWHNQFKQDFDYAQAKVNDILKQNTNLSPDQAKEVVRAQIDDKYFKQDENGEYVRKSPEEIDINKDPTAILNDPRMQGNIAIGGQDVLKKYIQSQKLLPQDYSTYASNKGFVNSKAYDIGVSGLQELSHDANGNPVLKMKTEDLNVGNGVQLRMLPKSTYDEMMGIPEVASAVNKMWNPVAAKIEQQFAQQGNVIDPHSEEMLKMDFIRKQIEDNKLDMSFITEKEKTVIPRPQTSINIYPNGPQSAETGSEFDRIGTVESLVGKHSGVKVRSGVVIDKNGNNYDGELVMPTEQLPAGLKAIIKPVLSQIDAVADYYHVKIVDGKIEAIKPTGGNWIDRQDLRNLQLQNNTEPLKAPQKIYGKPADNKPATSSKKKSVPWAN